MKTEFMFTSESVTEGHPDKLCDTISDAIVDHFLKQDPHSRIIAECAVSTAIVFIAARFLSEASVDFPNVARKVINQIGYDRPDFNGNTASIITSLRELPERERYTFNEWELTEQDINRIVAKNQVTVFGYACTQTPALLPMPIWLAHRLVRRLSKVRHEGVLPYLAPDGKSQVGVEFKGRTPRRIHSITLVVSQNKSPSKGGPDSETLSRDIIETVISPVFEGEQIAPDKRTRIFINPEGPYVNGGPSVHAGLTGRKNAIDTYGEYSRHSGAALSGKDPMRIDRVGAYVARYAAKNVVAAGLAEECEVQLSYSICLVRPVSIQVETFGTAKIADEKIAELIEEHFDFRLAGIVRAFNLRHLPATTKGGFYKKLAAYGQMGRVDMDIPWERTDKAEALMKA
ncbi:MAG: methionine adenosyltransferase [Actinobacteria bacterium]|nr:methionine adenosyltransferase [Actinomycetota bacterium]